MKKRKILTRTLTCIFTVSLILCLSVTTYAESQSPCDNYILYSDDEYTGVIHACEMIEGTDLYVCQSEEYRSYYECTECGNLTANTSVSFCDKCTDFFSSTQENVEFRFSFKAILDFLLKMFII